MNIRIESDFQFSVASMQYAPNGELQISLVSSDGEKKKRYEYAASLGDGVAAEHPAVTLLGYAREYARTSNIKDCTRDSYRLMCKHLEAYGDCRLERVTTAYLQGFVAHLHSTGLGAGTARLYFQKLTCVLHDAHKNELFDDRVLLRVKRPKREQRKKCYLTEGELKRLVKTEMPAAYGNIQSMFLFSCMTGLRFSDVRGLKWKNVRREGKHLQLEFHQQKTDTQERLPLCAEAEELVKGRSRSGEYVFERESNQLVNKVLKRWCKAARIKKPVTFHSARHTFCVLLLTKDVPIFTVQQLMCHQDIGTTKVYADLLNKTKAKAVRKMPLIGLT